MGEEDSFQGQPRASQSSLSSLESLEQLSEKRRLKHSKCLICQEDFPVQIKEPITRLPCHHLFHTQCITQWLNRSATCPCCRYELLTENEDYNVGVRERMAQRDVGQDTDVEEEACLSPLKESLTSSTLPETLTQVESSKQVESVTLPESLSNEASLSNEEAITQEVSKKRKLESNDSQSKRMKPEKNSLEASSSNSSKRDDLNQPVFMSRRVTRSQSSKAASSRESSRE